MDSLDPTMFTSAKLKLRYQLAFEGSWPTAVAFLASGCLAAGNQLGQIYVWEFTRFDLGQSRLRVDVPHPIC